MALSAFDPIGQVLHDIITKMLKMRNFPVENMREQGFNNKANIKGKKNDLQSMFLKVNPLASFCPVHLLIQLGLISLVLHSKKF